MHTDPAPTPAISVEGVSKAYRLSRISVKKAGSGLLERLTGRGRRADSGVVNALDNISLQVRRGECVGLIGRNGSGKSTLLKIIVGVLRPTSGSVTTRGRIESMLELGTGFNPEFTGRENIVLYATMLGVGRAEIERRQPELAAFAEIGEFMDRPVKNYSTGMVMRLAFAAFLLVKPDILIIDEAMSVGDIFFQQRCYDFMRNTLADATKIIVSHDPGQLSAFCSRLVILDRGRLDYDGPIGPGIERYLKSLHDEGASHPAPLAAPDQQAPASTTLSADLHWTTLPVSQVSGRGALRITKVAVTDPAGRTVHSREPGEPLVVHMLIRVIEPRDDLMFGYLLRDATGQQVCGQNSHILNGPTGDRLHIDLSSPGDWHVAMEFEWPPLKPQAYTLTLGVGEGLDAHQHIIQSWAHDCFQIMSFDPARKIHGLFGSGLNACRCQKI
jgi:ABC-type polysaccharide/polyol phosphate transport system ATPase subunit